MVTTPLRKPWNRSLLDFAMAGLTGLQAAATIAASCPMPPIILYTLFGFDAMISVAKKMGVREVITKGENSERLLEAIERYLGKGANLRAFC
jgi:DNA-binding NarL/FixJ family response regulator